ncbi:MAG: hypothetical protein H7A43_07185 [Verrucomicrobia bacterium]|nr:hypothetical protein [Kiritimatiellia bacterium]MCP5488418.1 hypothetical protein [Verrucomicrobiota bacterium]
MGRQDFWWIAVLVLIAAVWRTLLSWAYRDAISGDWGIVALMAKHMAEGRDWPVFFYGQAYMGSLEPMVSALCCRWLGTSVLAVNLGTVLVGVWIIPLLYGWAFHIAGRTAARWAGLFALIGPTYYDYYLISPRGGYALILILVPLILTWSCRLALGTSGFTGRERLALLGFGLTMGVGWWTSQILVPAMAVASVILLASWLIRRRWTYAYLLLPLGFLGGSAPWWVWNVQHHWASLGMADALLAVPLRHGIPAFLGIIVPRFLDYLDPGPDFLWRCDGLRCTLRWSVAIGWSMILLIAVGFVVADMIRNRRVAGSRISRLYLASALSFSVVFVLSAGCSSYALTRAARYALPLYPVLVVVTAAGVSQVGRTRWGRWGVRLWGLMLLVFFSGNIREVWGLLHQGETSRDRTAEAFAHFISEHPTEAIYGPFMQTSWLNFYVQEKEPFVDLPTDRYNPHERRADAAGKIALIGHTAGGVRWIEQTGGHAAVTRIEGLNLVHAIQPPPLSVTPISPDQWQSARVRGVDSEMTEVLTDQDMLTGVALPIPPDAEQTLYITFREPVLLSRILFYCPCWLSYPGVWRLDGKSETGSWETLGGVDQENATIWSGPRLFADASGYHARVDFAPVRVQEIALRAWPTTCRAFFSPAEISLYGPGQGSPDLEADLGRVITSLATTTVNRVYCERWAANRLAEASGERLWTPREPAIWDRTTGDVTGTPRESPWPISVDNRSALLVRNEDCEATRVALRGCGAGWTETPMTCWTLFRLAGHDGAGVSGQHELAWYGHRVFRSAGSLEHRVARLLDRLRSGSPVPASDPELLRELTLAHTLMPTHPGVCAALLSALSGPDSPGDRPGLAAALEAMTRIDYPATASFEGLVGFDGLSMDRSRACPGDRVTMRYFWSKVPHNRPTAFLHVVDDRGKIVAQDDFLVADGLRDETCKSIGRDGWPVMQQRMLNLPNSLSPGWYTLQFGLWYPDLGQRLKVTSSLRQKSRAIVLPVRFEVIAGEATS